MKKVEKILIGQDKTYLSEAITKLPSNCIFYNQSAKTFTYRGNRVKDAGFELGELVIYEEYVGVIYDYLINEREFIDGKKEKELN